MKKILKENNKKIVAILIIIVLISLVGSVSYSAWRYVFSGNENKIATGDVSIKFLESNTNVISLKNALPEADTVGKKEDSFDFAVTSKASYDTSLKYTLSIEKLSVDTGYTSLSDNQIKVYLTDYSNKELVSPTLISNLSNKVLYSKTNKHNTTNTSITDKYKIRVWIDKDVNATSWTKDSKFSYKFKIGIKSEEVEVAEPNEPVLDDAMIPVYYDETSETWKKADSSNKDNNWYNYDSKKWANSVTVSSTNRSTYKSASVGTEIPMDDILTMQVWIPRYKYKVWNYNIDGTVGSNEQQIEITFENDTNTTGEISCQDSISGTDGDPSETCKLKETNATCTDDTCNNKTYTHPAFTFGDKEIKGFWIGKFEVSATTSLDLTTISYKDKTENENIIANKVVYYNNEEDVVVKKLVPEPVYYCTILYDGTSLSSCSDTYFALSKPNIYSWTSGEIKLYEDSIMDMKNSSNSYGLRSSTDTHMIKNMEWGAVAYLSHSKYGTCTDGTCSEVGINNNNKGIGFNPLVMTGCGAKAGSAESSTCNAYNTTTGMLTSTTQNIYGVYDMSGGAFEHTMSNIVNIDGTTMIPGSSGYTTTTYPDVKYYDKYSYSTSNTTRKRSKLGDGIKEVYNGSSGWYSDYSYLAYSSSPWFERGGYYYGGASAGVLNSDISDGNSDSYYSSRLIITP